MTTARLERAAFHTSDRLDYFTEKGLAARTGHARRHWLEMAVRELVDNALDACEKCGTPPEIKVDMKERGVLSVTDNGPGIPAEVVHGLADFGVRISTNNHYVAPTRGQQGNALKTLLALAFVDDGEVGQVVLSTPGVNYKVAVRLDLIRQQPVVSVKSGDTACGDSALLRRPRGFTETGHHRPAAAQKPSP